ncbi:sugar phosphate isomerase/epimerase family protein [Chthonobacter rhizosphaerae]|uniref:sugar phosphate isomerase/epimerase family protein n=1 Tax=Chthonobacter rhizosphaerae TaxID=2735553 RepID=UPI0015EE8D4B|nr:sugar phosphate isomerase/epimerase [Chthonobacter rhizosphaerae]
MALAHTLSFQLYSSRNFPPLGDQLRTLRALGYTNVEPYGGLYADLPALKAALDDTGLAAESGHMALDRLRTDLPGAVAIARALGMRTLVAPYLDAASRPADAAGWRALAAELGRIGRALRAEGLAFAWHNHDFEFVALPDGSLPIDHILAEPDVELELDLAWVHRAGASPRDWLARTRGRLAAVHVKDVAPAGEKADEDGWADVGAGVLDWPTLWGEAVAAGPRLMIVEHDNPSDFARFARASAAFVASLAVPA